MTEQKKAIFVKYSTIAAKASALEALFRKYSCTMSPELKALCGGARKLSDYWDQKRTAELPNEILWESQALYRLAIAILPLDGHPRAEELLRKLADGDVSMLEQTRTVARDAFWEVELWSYINRAGLVADLIDPPDIVWEKDGRRTGIACKRIHSERHIQNVLSEAVAQIEKTTGFGIAAFQIDAVRIPPIKYANLNKAGLAHADASTFLQNGNKKFLRDHERHFLRYFSKDRLAAALVVTSCFVMLDGLYVNSQWCIWTHPQLGPEQTHRAKELFQAMNNVTAPMEDA